MSTLSATIDVADDALQKLSELLAKFPKGSRMRVAFSEEPVAKSEIPPLAEYSAQFKAILSTLPPSPWASTEEAMTDLRAGEKDD